MVFELYSLLILFEIQSDFTDWWLVYVMTLEVNSALHNFVLCIIDIDFWFYFDI